MALKTENLKPEVYRAFEDVIGPDYISQEPAIRDGYAFGMMIGKPGDKFSIRPLAVVLPGNTDEVQAIVKVCNRYGVRFKAHSSGFGFGLPGEAPHLCIDLRRMNRILEIDKKNRYAVFEPYTSFAALMNATIKKGLRTYVIGAGPSASPLANVTNVHGWGTVNCSAGWAGRVPLGLEWVLPDGEILRLGTVDTIGEWFNGDGPGPSLRGIMKGMSGPCGAMGVMTKLAVKLTPWYGPPKLESEGYSPSYRVKVPDCFRVYMFVFPSNEMVYEAMRLMQEEQLPYFCSRRGPFTQAAAETGGNKEVWELWQTGDFQEKMKRFTNNMTIGIDGSTPEELEFKEDCIRAILEKTGGEEIEEGPDAVTARFMHAFNGLGAVKGTFRATGGLGSTPMSEGTMDSVRMAHEKGFALKDEYAKKGIFLDDGDSTWVTAVEDFGCHMEVPLRYDPADLMQWEGMMEHQKIAEEAVQDWNLGLGGFECGSPFPNFHEERGERNMHYDVWCKKIKKMLDPNLVGEPGFMYPMPDEDMP